MTTPGSSRVEAWIAALASGDPEPCYLLYGDRVVAEPAAMRLAEAVAEKLGCEPQIAKRPAEVAPLLADLRTYSLFESAKVTVVVESAVLAEASAAAQLLKEAVTALPASTTEGEPTTRERNAALRLFQVLRLFEIDPYGAAAESRIEAIPDWAFAPKGGRAPSKSKLESLRRDLAGLLEVGRSADLQGWADSDVEELAAAVQGGLPPGHVLILAESSVATKHPVVSSLEERGAVARLGMVELDRKNHWQGLGELTDELARSTGVGIETAAVEELARRTLRQGKGGGFRGGPADGDSTARFAAEYRKLAATAPGRIGRDLVEEVVEDRGQEDAWEILDAVGAGRAGEALTRLSRLLSAADDSTAARLSFFSLLAGFGRQVAAIEGRMREESVPGGERHYGRFKSKWAPALQRELEDGRVNPLAGLHPFRLHRAYLAASAMPSESLASLPGRILETELALKGESRVPEAALASLICHLSAR